jgi:glutathione S-transferase
MRTLYHLPFLPSCRKARLVLGEKNLEHELKVEKIWEQRSEFVALNPLGEVPVLSEPNGAIIIDGQVICEYLDETYPDQPLIAGDTLQRAEIRRLVAWFDNRFFNEVTQNLVGEKITKRILRLGEPSIAAIRIGLESINYHLQYLSYLAEQRHWLAGNQLSLADLTAAAHLSAVDYLGDVPWDQHPSAKQWFMRIKCRPSFRSLLNDFIPGIAPVEHYKNLDF